MGRQIAVIDLGTNTFNLLIAKVEGENIKHVLNDKISVKLGKGGIGKNVILPDAFERGLNALSSFQQIIARFNVEKVVALGTSALRTSQNSSEFIKAVKRQFGIQIEIISGDREAELIYLGVRQTLQNTLGNFLILDIGGGSNEFILANKKNIAWKKSFKLGMARLNEKFHPSDPIQKKEIFSMNKYFENELKSLFRELDKEPFDYLVGAEGAFESFYNIMGFLNSDTYNPSANSNCKEISLDNYRHLHDYLLTTTLKERTLLKGLEPYRVEMIVPASVFVNYIVNKLQIKKVLVSPNSMKEGIAWEILLK